MKILQLIQKRQLRGAEIFASQLASSLQALGHDVIIMTLLEGSAELPFTGRVVSLNRRLQRRFTDIPGWRALANFIHAEQPDIIQANAGDTLKFAVFSKMMFGWHVPIVFRNANKVSDFVDTLPKRFFNKWLIGSVRHVVSVSELCRQDFIDTYSYDSSKTITIPIGLNLSVHDKNLPIDLQSVFSTGKVMVHVASFVKEKNHAGLLRIMKQLIDAGQSVKLLLIGDGGLRPAIENQIQELALRAHVFVLGYRTDVMAILAHAHVFVLPSRIEGLPGVILEAMYCKTPVVAYDVGGISEVVKNKETGWLIEAGDEKGFADAVQQVLGLASNEKIKFTDNAYRFVIYNFDNSVIAKRFEALYQKVLGMREG